MRFTPAFMVLEEFDIATDAGNALGWRLEGDPPKAPQATVKVLTERDLQRAHDDGYDAGYRAACDEYQSILSARDEEARGMLAAAEREFAQNCGARLAEDLQAAIREIRRELTDEAARCVLPFLESRLRAAAIADLAESLMEIAGGPEHGELRIAGPSSLVGALQDRLPEGWRLTARIDETAAELTAEMGASLFRTQIESWLNRVGEAAR